MTDTNTNAPAKKPTHRVYLVQSAGEGKQDQWTEIGAIWPHRDNQGGNISFKLIPMEILRSDARIVYRKVKDKSAAA